MAIDHRGGGRPDISVSRTERSWPYRVRGRSGLAWVGQPSADPAGGTRASAVSVRGCPPLEHRCGRSRHATRQARSRGVATDEDRDGHGIAFLELPAAVGRERSGPPGRSGGMALPRASRGGRPDGRNPKPRGPALGPGSSGVGGCDDPPAMAHSASASRGADVFSRPDRPGGAAGLPWPHPNGTRGAWRSSCAWPCT